MVNNNIKELNFIIAISHEKINNKIRDTIHGDIAHIVYSSVYTKLKIPITQQLSIHQDLHYGIHSSIIRKYI